MDYVVNSLWEEVVKLEPALVIRMFPDADYKHLETPNARRKLRWKPKS